MAFTIWNHKITVLCVAIRAHATSHHFLIWMGMVGQMRHADHCSVFMLKYAFYQWLRQRIRNTFFVVDRYLWLMGDKTIPDSAEPRLESFYPPFIAGIDLPHQGVVDSYNLQCISSGDSAVLHWAITYPALLTYLLTPHLKVDVSRT